MPYTPFHFPPSALAGWPLRRHLDLPTFLLANLAIDVEPLIATLIGLGPPPHGYAHTLLGATVVGAATGWVVRRGKRLVESASRQRYHLAQKVAVVSGIAGCWFHVLLDSVMYGHLQPFYPLRANPFHWPGSADALHLICGLLLVPAAVLFMRHRYWQTLPQKISLGLLGASAVGMVVWTAARVV